MRSERLARFLRNWIKPAHVELTRKPDIILQDHATGQVYLKRWWLIPRNRLFNLYLHQFCSSDPADEFHDDPWGNLSVVLRGSYIEWIATGEGEDTKVRRFDRSEGDFVFRRGKTTHRIDLNLQSDRCHASGDRIDWEEPCWTLFVTGPRLRRWGFTDIMTGTWTHWKSFGDRNSEAKS
jgi:hypothetical protein